jgi:endonuclease/exonuclease/phosphatase family metal-dependent hydrolase
LPEDIRNIPQDVEKELEDLKKELDNIPSKADPNKVLIATWNIRHFGNLTRKWESKPNDSPKRDFHSLWCIHDIVSRFDVIAIQELKSNIRAFRELIGLLGPDWHFLMTDETKGYRGNGERMVFLFDTKKVHLSGLACEIVIPEDPRKPREYSLDRQFARTPYAVGFRVKNKTFVLVTLHVIYGEKIERKAELEAIAYWLRDWALDINSWDHNLLALGDFNIDRKGDSLYDAFTSTNLSSSAELDKAPRTIFYKPGEKDTHKFYDQIAWYKGVDGKDALSLKYKNGGHFDFVGHVLKKRNLTKKQLSWHISDHYPLWAEFDTQ